MRSTSEMFSALLRTMLDLRVEFGGQEPPSEFVECFKEAMTSPDGPGTPEERVTIRAMNMVRVQHIQISRNIAVAMENVDEAGRMFAEIFQDKQSEIEELEARIEELEKHIAPERRQHPISDLTVRDAVWSLTQGKCAYCDTDIKRDGQAETRGGAFCVEHVVPASAGGPDNIANYVPACMSCNSSKGDRHVLMLLRRMQRRPDLVVVSSNEKAVS